MNQAVGIYLLGTAGCGKSTMTGAIMKWMTGSGMSVEAVNLDPGADALPYAPSIDVREWVTLEGVMEEYGLGPNGAQIVAADLVSLNRDKILGSLDLEAPRYILFDTPGQLELFAFREATRELVKGILPGRSSLLYLIDPFNARTPSGFISQVMLSNLSKLRFMLPSVDIISKSDMVEPEQWEVLNRWQEYPGQLLDDCMMEAENAGSLKEQLNVGLFRALEDLSLFSNLVPVSSTTGEGIDNVYRLVQLTHFGGDDLETRSKQE